MQCPKCQSTLANSAIYCGCGWSKKSQQSVTAPSVPCAHQECGIAAMCKIKTPTGWANLCWRHYDAHYAAQARANCAARGLHTTEQLRAEFKATAARLTQKLTNREFLMQREPGEDWDEPATA